MYEEYENIIAQLKEQFPQAELSWEKDELQVRFAKTHVSTATITKIEEIVFLRGKIKSNSKELIRVENGCVHITMTYWHIFRRVYDCLVSMGASVESVDINDEVAFIMKKDFLNYSQLEKIQDIINEELNIHVTDHDSIRVFGHGSEHVIYLRLKKYAN